MKTTDMTADQIAAFEAFCKHNGVSPDADWLYRFEHEYLGKWAHVEDYLKWCRREHSSPGDPEPSQSEIEAEAADALGSGGIYKLDTEGGYFLFLGDQ